MTTPNPLDDDAASELHSVHVPRVDAVKGPATGIPFLILKSQNRPGADAPITKGNGAMADSDVAETLDENLSDAVDAATDTAVNGDDVDAEAMAATSDPGSPEWEALDAAKARAAVTGLTALRSLVQHLMGREDAESFAGEGDGDVCDLMDACDAIDCALGIMAKFAVDEQAEADEAGDLQKSLDGAADLTDRLIKASVQKAGRVLSSANENAIQSAVDNLQNVLSQLQSAPMAAEGGEPVKVTKADGDTPAIPDAIADLVAQLAVAYQTWHDSGTVAPGVADTAGDAPADNTAAAPPVEPAPAPAEPVEDAAAPQPAAPAPTEPPAAHPETPAAPAADASNDDAQTAVAKSITDALEAKYREQIAALEKRLEVVEATPVNDGPMLAGQTPTVVARTGQDAAPAGADPLADLRKELEAERNPIRKAELQAQLANTAWKLAATGNAPRI
jgi:hypothetical protein